MLACKAHGGALPYSGCYCAVKQDSILRALSYRGRGMVADNQEQPERYVLVRGHLPFS